MRLIITGILTKPDLVDRGMEDTVVSIINNEIIPLNKGYMIVRCRGQQEINDDVQLDEAIMKEKNFFKDHPNYRCTFLSQGRNVSTVIEFA